MKLEFDADGFLTHPNFHDGLLTGIMLEPNDGVCFFCKNFEGSKARIIFPRVALLCANNFRQGNIILGIRIFDGDQIEQNRSSAADEFSRQFDIDVDGYLSKIAQFGWSVFEVLSSYGCDARGLFDGTHEHIAIVPDE